MRSYTLSGEGVCDYRDGGAFFFGAGKNG